MPLGSLYYLDVYGTVSGRHKNTFEEQWIKATADSKIQALAAATKQNLWDLLFLDIYGAMTTATTQS